MPLVVGAIVEVVVEVMSFVEEVVVVDGGLGWYGTNSMGIINAHGASTFLI